MEALTPADVQNALKRLNLDVKIQTFEASTATSQQAADAIGCELGQIVKSLAFIIDDQPILVLASGDQRIDDKKLAAIFNVGRKKVKTATAEECVSIYGYAPGGVPPFGHRISGLPTYLDDSLQRYEQLFAAGGSPNAIFPLTLTQLVAATGGQFADVKREAAV
ncbi:MAG: YbaK/EbsC family protein [Chitinophagaceae bacterium]|nr:YbaK/EbsC family protein [Anaerolineae bacterium]